MDIYSLIIPAFIAGILTFLAPCTLPVVPGYLGFISGVSLGELKNGGGRTRLKVFLNGLLYVIGFSAVFILIGSLFGLGGSALAQHRIWVARVGGVFVILFGLLMLGLDRFPFFRFLSRERELPAVKFLKPGSPWSSLLFGSAFAVGWSPCAGPILGAVLTLAASSATVGQGAFLLAVFSAGLAVPFLAVAASVGWASEHLGKLSRHLGWVSAVGGAFLIFLGILLLTDQFNWWLAYAYRLFRFIDYDRLLDYL